MGSMTYQIGFSSNIAENAALGNECLGKLVIANYFGYVLFNNGLAFKYNLRDKYRERSLGGINTATFEVFI